MALRDYLRIDSFLLTLLGVVALASVFPCQGNGQQIFEFLTTAAIALLFFMHGAKLSRAALLGGIGHWRLHLLVFASTFVLFPLLGLAMHWLVPSLLSQQIYLGFLYLCLLPATVQSAIAFTAMGKGNVAAAVCSASASSILGVFISPLLVGLLMHTEGGASQTLDAIGNIMLQLMLPFVLGHLARPWISQWLDGHKKWINQTDRGAILLVVYTAFSEAVVKGIWQQVNGWSLLAILLGSLILLLLVLLFTTWSARWLGFSREDEVTIVFCGSKKSLANGIPMASVLFPAAAVGMMVLPLMIFHQVQLMVCAVLAARYNAAAIMDGDGVTKP